MVLVEARPQDTPGKKMSASFAYNGTRSHLENAGFSYERSKVKNHCVTRRTVSSARTQRATGALDAAWPR